MKPKPVIDFSMDSLFREFFDIENFKSQISNDCFPHSVCRKSNTKFVAKLQKCMKMGFVKITE